MSQPAAGYHDNTSQHINFCNLSSVFRTFADPPARFDRIPHWDTCIVVASNTNRCLEAEYPQPEKMTVQNRNIVRLIILALPFVGCQSSDPDVSGAGDTETAVSEPATPPSDVPETIDLAGTWRLDLPSGAQLQMTVRHEAEDRYQLSKPGSNFDGIYELQGDRLVMIEPKNPPFSELVWQVEDADHLTLVAQPPIGRIGNTYLNAKLSRYP